MKLNLNNKVKVTLTKDGKKLLSSFRDSLVQEFPEHEWNKYIPDGDEFTCQFWELFDIFQGQIRPEPFLMDVELL